MTLTDGQRVIIVDYLGNVVGRGRVRADDRFRPSDGHTWVTWVGNHGRLWTDEFPTRELQEY